MHQQGRQGKVVDPVRLIRIAEIRQIFSVGDVGLGNNDRIGLRTLDDQTKQSNQLMGLGQIHAGSARFLPQESHRIEAEHPNTRIQQLADNADELHHYSRVAEIKVDLIRAESAPHRLIPGSGRDHIE